MFWTAWSSSGIVGEIQDSFEDVLHKSHALLHFSRLGIVFPLYTDTLIIVIYFPRISELYFETRTWQHVDMIRVRSEIPVVRDTLQSGVTPAPVSQVTFSCGASTMPHITGLINNAA